MTRARVGTGVARHFGKASLAEATAALNSEGVQRGRRETMACVAGLTTSMKCFEVDSTVVLLMNILTVGCMRRV